MASNVYYDIGPKETLKEKLSRKWNKTKEWCKDNVYTIVTVAPLGIGLVAKTVQVIGRGHNIRMKQRQKDLHVWDPTLGHYWELRRKLRNEDWVTINRRHDLGESLGQILDDMDVLKY